MARVDFYHLTTRPLEDALPRLLDRVLQAGKRAVVLTATQERAEDLAELLWEDRDAWRPHGTETDGHAADQPIWITANPEDNPNAAEIIVLTEGMDSPQVDRLERTLDIFNGRDDSALQAARQRWKARCAAGHLVIYWQQDDAGRWTEGRRHDPDAS